MHLKIIYVLELLILISCSQNESNFSISGTFSDVKEFPVKLYQLGSEGKILLDSAVTDDKGAFKLSGNANTPILAELKLPEQYSLFLVLNDNDNIKITGSLKNIRSGYYIKGSQESERLKTFILEQNRMMDNLSLLIRTYRDSLSFGESDPETLIENRKKKKNAIVKKHRDFTLRFIEENPASFANIFALYQYIDPVTPVIDIKNHFEYFKMVDSALVKTYPNCEPVIELNKQVAKVKEERMLLKIGVEAPLFALPDTVGDTLLLTDFKGKYILLVFWASWNTESVKQNQLLKRLKEDIKSDDLEILAVSLDKSKAAWLNAISRDSLNWIHLSDLKFWNSNVVPIYRVNSLPLNYLINPEGIIVAKDIYNEELINTVKDSLIK